MQLAGQARMGRAQGSAGLTGRRGGVDPVGFLGCFFFFFVFPSPETTGERANKRLKDFASKRIAASRQVRKANKDALAKLRAWSCIHGKKWKIENMELTASTQAKVHPQGHPSPTGRHCRGRGARLDDWLDVWLRGTAPPNNHRHRHKVGLLNPCPRLHLGDNINLSRILSMASSQRDEATE